MTPAEKMREDAAKVAEGLEAKWRASAAQQREIYDRCWIGGHGNLHNAQTMTAAADGLAAVAKVIRSLPIEGQ